MKTKFTLINMIILSFTFSGTIFSTMTCVNLLTLVSILDSPEALILHYHYEEGMALSLKQEKQVVFQLPLSLQIKPSKPLRHKKILMS